MYLFYCFTIAYIKTIHYSWKFIQNYDNKEWKINHEYLLFEEYFYAFLKNHDYECKYFYQVCHLHCYS